MSSNDIGAWQGAATVRQALHGTQVRLAQRLLAQRLLALSR